jgi:hypothetical protein
MDLLETVLDSRSGTAMWTTMTDTLSANGSHSTPRRALRIGLANSLAQQPYVVVHTM